MKNDRMKTKKSDEKKKVNKEKHRVRHTILAIIATVICISTAAFAQTNVLVNGDFESNPPTGCGNHIPWSILPWVIGTTGQQANVVTVDGNQNCHYGTNGPQSDASAPGVGIPQHYLDIADGSNDFYQSFTPQCSGQVVFGGSFSTRGNKSGTAYVTLREGVGTSGNIIGQTNTISLPSGNSQTEPWTPVSYTAPITAFTTYSLVVHMDNNMNFDNGFVEYQVACNPPDPCCPPWNKYLLEDMMFYQGQGSISAPYTLHFQPTATFKLQMQAYLNYLHSVNPAITSISIDWSLYSDGTGTLPVAPWILIPGTNVSTTWNFPGTGNYTSVPSGQFFTGYPMIVGTWYEVHTVIHLNNGQQFFSSKECAVNNIFVRIQVNTAKKSGGPVLEFSDGKRVVRTVPIQ